VPFTQTDAAKLTRNMLVRGVIETIIEESPVLNYLPFVTVSGSGVTYNQELTLGSVAFYGVGDTWAESAMTVQQQTAALKILGGDADVDAFLQQTYSNLNDIKALVIQAKAKSLANTFNNAFFNGDSSVDTKSFDGLAKLTGTIATSLGYTSTVRACSNGANGAVLTLDMMDELIDAIKPGRPQALFMSKKTRRKLSSLRRASGNILELGTDAFGRRVVTYDGIPLEVDDHIPDNESQGTSNGVCSSIYAVQFGFQSGVCGLQNGGITVQPLGALETKDAWRTRMKWYVGLALFRSWAAARLAGVKVA
jgi:HK97 family phage major capsid protein